MSRITRKQFLTVGAGSLLAAASYPLYVEPRLLESSVTQVGLNHGIDLRVAHLSDLHSSSVVPFSMISHAVDVAIAQKPHLIVLTGDFITHRDETDTTEYAAILRRLSSNAPTFAVFGNHDGGRWAGGRRGYRDHTYVERLLKESNIELLHNTHRVVEANGQKVNLVGTGDLWSHELDPDRAFRTADAGLPTILLSHNPDSKERLCDFAWDLMLCGHTHGGQVLLPFCGPRWAPVADKRFVAGLKPWNGKQIYVTRGVGNLFGIRFRCPPEVSLLHLRTA